MSKNPETLTRAQAERAITQGADPTLFAKHSNYHVRRKAWEKAGRPLSGSWANWPEDLKFLEDLRVKNPERFQPAEDAPIVRTVDADGAILVDLDAPTQPTTEG